MWVVWALSVLVARLGDRLVFKGGTSLSKAYGAVDRFSEDVDLTYDIRRILEGEDGLAPGGDGLPPSASKARRWTEKVRARLSRWIEDDVEPLLAEAVGGAGQGMRVERVSADALKIRHRKEAAGYAEYVKPEVLLEFGARSTGEPAERIAVACDAAPHLPDIAFPTASPRVMAIERTFWEKATAAHVYCLRSGMSGERFVRHWHDLAALARHPRYRSALADRRLAEAVARHKSLFFRMKDPADGNPIDYLHAVRGNIRLVPDGPAARALEQDYAAMLEAGVLYGTALPFPDLMAACRAVEHDINATAAT